MSDTLYNTIDYKLDILLIEKFCYDATIPVKGGTSYNQIFKPKPAHLIRAVI